MMRFPTFDHLLAYRDAQLADLHAGRITRNFFRDRIYRATRKFKRDHRLTFDPASVERKGNRRLTEWLTRHEADWFGRSDPTPESVRVQRELVARWFKQTGATVAQLRKEVLRRQSCASKAIH
jgi:hypothetical protein